MDRVGARLTPLLKHRLHGWLLGALLKLHGTKRPRQTQGSWPLLCEVRALTTYRGCFRCLGCLSHLSPPNTAAEVLHMTFYIPHLGLPLMLGQLTLRCHIRSELIILSTRKSHKVNLLLWPSLHMLRRTKHLSLLRLCGNELTKGHSTGPEVPEVQVSSHLTFQIPVGDGFHLDHCRSHGRVQLWTGMKCVAPTNSSWCHWPCGSKTL